MKIAIRDDDISFFTTPEELEGVWSGFGLPITFAVTPFMVESEHGKFYGREYDFHQTGKVEFPLRMNDDLIEYLRCRIFSGSASIALHGCNHQYKATDHGLVAEYAGHEFTSLKEKTERAKKEVENLFQQNITVFCPPDNAISREGLKAVASSGIQCVQRAFPLKYFDVPISLASLRHFMSRIYFRVRHQVVYSKPFPNGFVIEAAAYLFKDSVPLEKMIRDFDIFHQRDLPFTIATHYWELKNEPLRIKLLRLLDYINSKPNVVFCALREVFE